MKERILSSYNRNYLKQVLFSLRILPSLHIGSRAYHSIFPRRANIIAYITNRCNSRCIMCNYWQQPIRYDLSIELIKNLINAKSTIKNGFLLQGGETIMHPKFEEILVLFKREKINNIVLLTNGILTEKLVYLVTKYKISNVTISLDGRRDTYKRLRGSDCYDDVINTIEKLRDKTTLSVCFSATPWNDYEDYLFVNKLCEDKNIRLMFNIYSKGDYVGKTEGKHQEEPIDKEYENYHNPYVSLYNRWLRNEVKFPCLNMRFLSIVMPNGNVVLCQCKTNVVLGNLYENSFDEIWNSERTKEIQREHKNCDACWIASHRPFDVKFSSLIRKTLPSRISEKVLNTI